MSESSGVGKKAALKFELYRDGASAWRWRLKAANGKTIADSGEGYHNKSDCRAAIELVRASAGADVAEE